MAQHFLLSAKARTLSIGQVLRMTTEQAEATFAAVRWAETAGKAVCPHCGCRTCYEARRPNGALRSVQGCRKDFSLTSGTLFAFHKLPLRTYLAAIVIFCNEVKGKSALALSRDLGVQYKTAFVLAHKLREAMASEIKGIHLGGAGKTVEIDGGYFGGYVKPANHKENRRDRRLARNQNGKRRCVVVIRERDGKVLPAAFRSEGDALSFIRNRVARETEIMVDESGAWNALASRYSVKVINHQRRLQHGRRLHERRGELLQPDAPRRAGPPPPHQRRLSRPLRSGERMARGSSPGGQRRPGARRGRAGAGF